MGVQAQLVDLAESVEAIQFVGDDCAKNNAWEIVRWVSASGGHAHYQTVDMANGRVVIGTPEGDVEAFPGWWVIRDANGAFHPCRPSLFDAITGMTG